VPKLNLAGLALTGKGDTQQPANTSGRFSKGGLGAVTTRAFGPCWCFDGALVDGCSPHETTRGRSGFERVGESEIEEDEKLGEILFEVCEDEGDGGYASSALGYETQLVAGRANAAGGPLAHPQRHGTRLRPDEIARRPGELLIHYNKASSADRGALRADRVARAAAD